MNRGGSMSLLESIFQSGDDANIAWQVTKLEDLHDILDVILAQEEPGLPVRPLVYLLFVPQFDGTDVPAVPEDTSKFRFSSVWGMLPERTCVIQIPLSHRFERFTADVFQAVRNHAGALFLFDCLSELQEIWSTDMMMENFFSLITPLIKETGSRAVFPLIRSRHSEEAIAGIRDRADDFLDLYAENGRVYVRAQKLSGTVPAAGYHPHYLIRESRQFEPIEDGVILARFHHALERYGRPGGAGRMDSWDRFFYRARRDYEEGYNLEETCSWMCKIMLTRDKKLQKLIVKHFTPEDYFFIKEHMVGTGLVGGKTCGMLLSRKLIENLRPDLAMRLEPHDSFFVGSDVYYTYLVANGLWELRILQQTEEGYFTAGKELQERIEQGVFPERIRKELVRMLDYYGQCPVIVRSSSILEDGFGNAFAGKYESVFCANTGTPEERLAEFENAIRTVYASTMNPSALEYRLQRGLSQRDEQMGLLVQRVSGTYFGDYFMPCAAGVGYSHSAYRFLEDLDPAAGMLRLVMGLGTMAVDQTGGSYPRLVSLDRPEATSFHSSGDHHRHSQQLVGLISCSERKLTQIPLSRIEKYLPGYLQRMLLSNDTDAERSFRERGESRQIRYISCAGLVKNHALMEDLREILQVLHKAYGNAVDLEFAVNLAENGEYVINLLQCRPLQGPSDEKQIVMPAEQKPEHIFLKSEHASMGNSCREMLDYVIYIDPVRYYNMPYSEKNRIANLIHDINWKFRNQNQKIILMLPGRVGTSSPELGVPVSFADISGMTAVFEMAESRAGYQPELSYGSHFFQDLVESGILYGAVHEDARTVLFQPELLKTIPNRIAELNPKYDGYKAVAGLYCVSGRSWTLYHDLEQEKLLIYLDKLK